MAWSVARYMGTLPYDIKDTSTMFHTTQNFRKWQSLQNDIKKILLLSASQTATFIPKWSLDLARKLHEQRFVHTTGVIVYAKMLKLTEASRINL